MFRRAPGTPQPPSHAPSRLPILAPIHAHGRQSLPPPTNQTAFDSRAGPDFDFGAALRYSAGGAARSLKETP
jgi:hypothetical protein